MICFPNAKVNLGLSILSKRPDGFHNLETVFYPLPFTDVLEMVEASSATSLHLTGLPVPGNPDENLVLRAWSILKKKTGLKGHADIHLHKAIPMGSGLGGGSSDAAFFLNGCNEFYGLHLTEKELADMAILLGSDCPFFLRNRTCYATGRGEILEELDLDLSSFSFGIVDPGIHISTSWAFSRIQPRSQKQDLREIMRRPVSEWKNSLHNDFERPVTGAHPQLRKIREDLYAAGAVYASLSGSGSAFYGIFPKGMNPVHQMPAGLLFHFIP